MPGKKVMLAIPVPIKRRNHRKDTGKLSENTELEESCQVLGAKVKAKRDVPNCCTKNKATRKACRTSG